MLWSTVLELQESCGWVLEGAPGHGCSAPMQVTSCPALHWHTGAAGRLTGGLALCHVPSALFCSLLGVLLNLETNLFAPSWDQSCLCMATMHHRNARMQRTAVTMHVCDT